jgi:dephospho-CoA kinase
VFLVGLTGNYGMGKSSVLSLFKKFGALTINTDEIVSSLLKERDTLEKIKGLLGREVFLKNGSLNTKSVADIIFHNDSLRHSLEDILHPLVFERINLLLDGIEDRDQIIVIEIPLLFERGYEGRFDKTVTVYAKKETALDRLEKQGISREKALLRLKSQLSVEEKIRRSDFVIDNNGTIEETMPQVETLCKELLKEAKKDENNTGSRKLKQELS